jgi:Domain of unknown function (DUF6542)
VPDSPEVLVTGPRPVGAPHRTSGRGVTGRGTVVLIVVVTAVVGLLEVVIGGHRGHLFGIAFAATSAAGALVVRRRDLPVAMIAPPLLYTLLIVLMSAIDTKDATGSLRSREAVYLANAFVTGAPAMWTGTAAAAAIGWYRLRRFPVSSRRVP